MPVNRADVKAGVELVHDSTPYPQDVLVVSDMGGELRASPLGGGFVYHITDAMLRVCHIATEAERTGMKMLEEYFQIDDGPIFKGWHTNVRWNGWHQPVFDFETAKRVCEAFRFDWWRYHEPDDAFYTFWENSDEVYEWPSETIMVDGQQVKAYGIGAGCFTWSTASICCDDCGKDLSVKEIWTNSYDETVCRECTDTPNRGPLEVVIVKERMGLK